MLFYKCYFILDNQLNMCLLPHINPPVPTKKTKNTTAILLDNSVKRCDRRYWCFTYS